MLHRTSGRLGCTCQEEFEAPWLLLLLSMPGSASQAVAGNFTTSTPRHTPSFAPQTPPWCKARRRSAACPCRAPHVLNDFHGLPRVIGLGEVYIPTPIHGNLLPKRLLEGRRGHLKPHLVAPICLPSAAHGMPKDEVLFDLRDTGLA